jgi:hypothetical protein
VGFLKYLIYFGMISTWISNEDGVVFLLAFVYFFFAMFVCDWNRFDGPARILPCETKF